VRSLLKHYESHFSWGPTGSVALEFASGGGQWVHADSDLDIVLNTPVRIEKEVAVRLVTEFAALAVRVDALIEGPAGALSLQEWAMRAAPWLVRTEEGPILTATPWAVMGCRSVS
jgi:phosphoribosyl-dephospho-CoA transferase